MEAEEGHTLPREAPAAWRDARLGVGFAMVAALLLNVVPTLLMDVIPNYDRQTHLFMADHYLHGWFDAWEPRWFGGFCMFSYPPLAHQVVAMGGWFVSLEAAYAVVQVLTLVGMPLAMGVLAREVLDRDAAAMAALLSAVASSTCLVAYGFGMIPTLLAFALALAAAASLLRYLRTGRRRMLLAWTALGAATMAAHHLTCILCLPALTVAVIAGHVGQYGRRDLMRIIMALACLVVSGTLVILPFWWWLLTMAMPQAEIPHYTRGSLWSDPDMARRYLLCMGGGALLISPFALWTAVRDRRTAFLAAAIVLFALLGLGGTTPLPRLLFPGWWRWLTYDRFAYWASMLILLPAGAWLHRCRPRAQAAVLLVCLGFAALSATQNVRVFTQPLPLDHAVLVEMQDFLRHDERERYYYATIGLAESELAHLSRSTRACTLDGLYHTARRDAFQRESGCGPQDTVLVWGRPGERSFMRDVLLTHPHAFGLRYVFSSSLRGNEVLRDAGWSAVGQFHPEGYREVKRDSVVPCQVTAWEAPHPERVRPLREVATEVPSPLILCALWGCLPVLALVVGLVAAAGAVPEVA